MSVEQVVEDHLAPARPAYVVPRVNLLPPEIRESSRLRVVQAGLVGAVLVAASVVTVAGLAASDAVEQARGDLVAAQAAKVGVDTEVAQLAGVRDLTAQLDAAEELLTQVSASRFAWSRVLNDLSLGVPDGVWVETLTVSPGAGVAGTGAAGTGAAGTAAAGTAVEAGAAAPGAIAFTGRARSHDDVAAWLEALAAQPGLSDPTFTSSTVDESLGEPTVTFSSTVAVTPEVLTAGKEQR